MLLNGGEVKRESFFFTSNLSISSIFSDVGVMLKTSASLSPHSENLTLPNLLDTNIMLSLSVETNVKFIWLMSTPMTSNNNFISNVLAKSSGGGLLFDLCYH